MKFLWRRRPAQQLDLQALHRVRERSVSQLNGIINQIRAFLLERGVAVRHGLRFLRAHSPHIHPRHTAHASSPRIIHIIEGLARIGAGSMKRIVPAALLAQDPGCEAAGERSRHWTDHLQRYGGSDRARAMRLKGRDFAAWLGLVPKQTSTGDRTILGKISKRGEPLHVCSVRPSSVGRTNEAPELGALWPQALDRSGQNAAALRYVFSAIARANKLARIAWSVLAHGRNFRGEASHCASCLVCVKN